MNLHILVIDDERTYHLQTQLTFYTLGYKITCLESGTEAIHWLKNCYKDNPVDLILLDMMMPDMLGIEVLKILKANVEWEKIPVIIQTGLAYGKEVEEAMALGANGFIGKPFFHEELINKTNALFALS